jgi:hypothetical protein
MVMPCYLLLNTIKGKKITAAKSNISPIAKYISTFNRIFMLNP